MTPTESECEAANILTNIKVGSGFIRSQYKINPEDSAMGTLSSLSDTHTESSSISTTVNSSISFQDNQPESQHSMVGDLDALALAALQASSSAVTSNTVPVLSSANLSNVSNNFVSQTDESGEFVSYVMAPPATGSVPKARGVKKIATKVEGQIDDGKKVIVIFVSKTENR